MGHPKKQRRKYSRPKHMFKAREGERELIQVYGLKNARELWKSKSEVGRIRSLARGMLARPDEKKEKDVMGRLIRMGLIGKEAKLEDVLDITIENILDRRLQTQVYKRGVANSIKQARQEIVHGHIAVAGRRITAPGHLTTLEEAERIDFYAGSALNDPEHPIRKVEKKASSEERVEEDAKPAKAKKKVEGATEVKEGPKKVEEAKGAEGSVEGAEKAEKASAGTDDKKGEAASGEKGAAEAAKADA